MNEANANTELKYAAFISYSHVDREAARWLHRAIEGFRVPARLGTPAAAARGRRERLAPVFLDREELATSISLAESVRKALQASDFLIVVCSRSAARSRWVNEEVREFKAMGRGERILCLIVDGEPRAQDKGLPAEQECLVPALLNQVVDGSVSGIPASEPLAADIRSGGDARRDAKLKIIAGMLGVSLDDLRHRDQARRQKRLAAIGVASTVGCVILAGLAVAAWLARNEAEEQRRLAEQKSLTAERTADFMISLFKVADPSEARGNSITAREILDRGVRQIDASLRDEPQVRAALTTTLGEVYTGLGLYKPALELLHKAQAVPGQPVAARLHQTLSLAEVEFQHGNDARAEELLAAADALDRQQGFEADPALRARLLLARGEVAAVREDDEAAQRYLGQALELGKAFRLDDVTPRALEGLGLSSYYAGNLGAAEQWYEKALAARIEHSGELHPRASETLNALGAIAYMRGDSKRAETFWLRSLDIDRRVLGEKHPNLATTMNNLGRLHVERREFTRAIEMLDEAVSIDAAELSDVHEGRIFGVTNLALAHMGLQDYGTAEPLLRQALSAASATKHRLEGPILTDLADLECRTRRTAEGLARLEQARPIVAARYPDDPWRVALVDNVRAGCLAGATTITEAESLTAGSLPIVLEKWPANSYYGHEAVERAKRIYAVAGNRDKLGELSRLEDPG